MNAEPIAAIVALMLDDGAVTALVGRRVFAVELPETENQKMPRACVVLRRAGGGAVGPGARSYVDWTVTRIDAFCYGKTPLEAIRMHAAVERVFAELDRTVIADTLLHNAVITGGPVDDRNEEGWPYALGSYEVSSQRADP